MTTRTLCLCTLLAAALCCTTMARAQVTPSAANSQMDEQRIRDLETRIRLLTSMVEDLTTSSEKVAAEVQMMDGKVTAIQDEVGGLSAGVKELKQEVEVLKELVAEQTEIVGAISRRDGSGNPILSLRSNMQASSEFRQEVNEAVHDSLHQQGTLTVTNKMGTQQVLLVNSRRWEIPAQAANFKIPVKVGTLTTELVGQESPKNWTITPPNYEQGINIQPAPVSSIIVNRPLILNPFGGYYIVNQTTFP